jgi:uncharacterized protein (DUF2336 family)
MSDMGKLAQLAVQPQDTSREEVYLAVASLYRVQSHALSERERALMQDIMRRLTKDVEISARMALAERLADDETAPHELILLLAHDQIEVARPLLLRSAALTDEDLSRLITECGEAHRQTIAARIKTSNAPINHPATTSTGDLPPPKTPSTEGAQKLIDKLAASGQLKAGFLVRVLNQGQTDLFDLALAKLVDLPLIELRSRFYHGGPRAVALACRGVGIDRCVFPTVFSLSRCAHNMRTNLSFDELAEVDRVFATVPKTSALGELSSLTFN